MDSMFIYTRKEFAQQLGVTKECLKTRMRRGWYKNTGHCIVKDDKYFFRKWEGEIKPKKITNRGGHDDAVKKNRYPNKAMEEHNRMKRFLAVKKQLSQKELNMVPAILEQIKNNSEHDEVVYFITYYDPLIKKEDRLIKIGKTKERTVNSRFSSIQSCCPFDLTLLTYSKNKTEKFFHEKFKEHRIRGEWFKYKPVLDYLKNEHEEEYRLPDVILNTMKQSINGEYVSKYSDEELCETWFKVKII